jgi:hypothetical protein
VTVAETLIAARALIADPVHWTQEVHARDKHGMPVLPTDPDATCFCADGALTKAAGVIIDDDGHWGNDEHYYAANKLLCDVTYDLTQQRSYARVNDGDAEIEDHEAHAAVLMIFDRAINLANQNEANREA